MSLAFIRKWYQVPAKRGARVAREHNGVLCHGTIKSAHHARLRVLFDGERHVRYLHPKDVTYLPNPKD